jgi:hypothetical protein
MKTKGLLFIVAVACLFHTQSLSAQPPSIPLAHDSAVTERGLHHRVWQTVVKHQSSDGTIVSVTNAYTELGTFLHYEENGQLLETREVIEVFQRGAVARYGPHKVLFAPNINTAGAIDVMTPDNLRLRSHPIGLAYFDAAPGGSVMFAAVKDSVGKLVAPNQIIYTDAFSDIAGDIRYTYRRDGFAQDIVFRENPPAPEQFGLNPETTLLSNLGGALRQRGQHGFSR